MPDAISRPPMLAKPRPERAVAVGQLRDLPRRELRHQHRDLEHDRPQPAGVLDSSRCRSCRPWRRNVIRFSEARLQAVSSRNMYSEHGFDARIGPDFGQVCQSLMVVWNWMPGSADAQAAWPILSHSSRALSVLATLPCVRAVSFQSLSSTTALQELVGDAHRVVASSGPRPSDRPRCPNRCRRSRSRSP